MPRARNDPWMPGDDWPDPDEDHPDSDADPANDHCPTCGLYVTGPVCQGPGPYPRPCAKRLRMPAAVAPDTAEPPAVAGADDGETVTVEGVLRNVDERATRGGARWATAVLAVEGGEVAVSIYPNAYADRALDIVDGAEVCLTGRVDRRGDAPVLAITDADGVV